jgi:hypothetical protein
MAITKNAAVQFFNGLTKGTSFWAQKSDGTVVQCGFSSFEPDDAQNPTTGIVTFGISIYPISADFEVTFLNLDSIGAADSLFIDFKVALADISFSTLFGGGGSSASAVKAPVLLATTANLVATASGSGIGKTLTSTGVGVLTLDGTAVVVDNRILVKNQDTLVDNGIYIVTNPGSGLEAWILTRAVDFDEQGEVVGGVLVTIQSGDTQADTTYILDNINGTATIDTDDLQFILYPTTILEEIKSQTLTVSFSNEAEKTFSVIMNTSSPKILSTRVYLSTASSGFDKQAHLSFYNNPARRGEHVIQRFEKNLCQTLPTGNESSGSSEITVTNTLSYHPHDLCVVDLTGGSQEFIRLSDVDQPNSKIELEDTLANNVTTAFTISKVMEASGFSCYDGTNNKTMYLKLSFASSITEDIKIDMVYSEF